MDLMTKRAIDSILGFLFSITVTLMFTYLIFWKNRSPWWYLMAIVLIGAFKPSQHQPEAQEKEKEE
jgi:hypothetical protein